MCSAIPIVFSAILNMDNWRNLQVVGLVRYSRKEETILKEEAILKIT